MVRRLDPTKTHGCQRIDHIFCVFFLSVRVCVVLSVGSSVLVVFVVLFVWLFFSVGAILS